MEKTPVEKLKIKSLIAIVIMFVVLVSMGMATYSWYIVSTAPQVKAVETYMNVIDPMLSIARATDEFTPPDELGNDVTALAEENRDITWGTRITTYGNNTIVVNYPATLLKDSGDIAAPAMDDGGRLGQLEKLTPGEMGEEKDAKGYKMNGIRYYRTSDGKICAAGLGVWVRINQTKKDLVAELSNIKFTDAQGEEMLGMDCAGVSVRVINEGRTVPCGWNEEKGAHYCTVFSAAEGNEFPANIPVLLELVVYIEGDTVENNGVIAADISNGLCVNIDRITFYDNADFDASAEQTEESETVSE